jgi:hypothetical protein
MKNEIEDVKHSHKAENHPRQSKRMTQKEENANGNDHSNASASKAKSKEEEQGKSHSKRSSK